MAVGLQPLEFSDCLTDSPYFRENLHAHEKELERTSQQIKRLSKEVKDLLLAAKNLSRAQRSLSTTLKNFSFACIGTSQTDDEVVILKSLARFGQLIDSIEDERDRMLTCAYQQIIEPLDKFRKEKIGAVKEEKKKFDKQSAKFYQSQERNLNLSTKKKDAEGLQESDAQLQLEHRHFCQASLEYVFVLQEAQERKKFEFVEILLGFMFGWLTFYHQGHEVAEDSRPYFEKLQLRIQKTRENFDATRYETESLMKKMLEMRQTKAVESGTSNKLYTREGYLFIMEKKAFGTTWTKYYCTYQRDKKELTMIPHNSMTGKLNSQEKMILASCVRRMSDSIEKRFCFDVTSVDRPGMVYTLQALSEEDRKLWMDVMDGKEPVSEEPTIALTYTQPGKVIKSEERALDEVGFMFVNKCIESLESRGLEEQGLYRVVGITSKVTKLLSLGLDRRKLEKLNLDDAFEWESKTITSALKTYLRNLPEPLTTFRYHDGFIAAAKQETHQLRVNDVHTLMHRLPPNNFSMLEILIHHLTNVAAKANKNLMSVSNLGVCFGPTLLRPEEETVAAIMNIKFCNVVVEILIENYEKIFKTEPENLILSSPEIRPDVRTDFRPDTGPDMRNYVKVEPTYISTTAHSAGAALGPMRIIHHPPQQQQQQQQQQHHGPPRLHYVRNDLSSGLSSSMHNVAAAVAREADAMPPLRYHHPGEHMTREHAVPTQPQPQPQQAQPQQPAHQRQIRHIGPSTRTTAYSEGNLLNIQQHQMQKAKAQPFYGTLAELGGNRPDPLNSTSSSNESVSSVSSRDREATLQLPANYLMHTPQKSKRGIVGKMSYHTASTYQPQESLRRVRTLYACLGEHDGELSFEPNQIITNVRSSVEPGWLEGTLNGKSGLVPENYVEVLP